MRSRATCPRKFEPHADPDLTHTCGRRTPHHGVHVCPTCLVQWRSVPGPGPNLIVKESPT